MKKCRILLVDEDKLFRLRVRHMLEQEEDMEIVGDCVSAEEVLSQIEKCFPDIVLMDTWLPGMNGIEACHRLTKNWNACDIIMLTTDQEPITQALSAGAAGYFPKELKSEELTTAIRLTCKWQSLRAKCESNIYSTRQAETMIMENLVRFAAEETHNKDEPEWLPPQGNGSNTVPEVTLVIPSSGDASQLQKFICQVKGTLKASILGMVSSWSDTRLTLKLQRPVSLADILNELTKIPEVEEAREKIPVRAGHSSFSNEVQAMPGKQISVALRGQAQSLTSARQANQHLKLPKLKPHRVRATVS